MKDLLLVIKVIIFLLNRKFLVSFFIILAALFYNFHFYFIPLYNLGNRNIDGH